MTVVPDWTYHPLRPMANALIGERRAQLLALRLLSGLIALPGGGRAIERVLLVAPGVGVFIGGVVISTVGLTFVFVPTDLEFMHTDAATLDAANAHLLPFIAHDRAGFGGALMATAVAIVLLGVWGWRQGEAWVWWTLLGAAVAGSAGALVIHFFIHYTAFVHLLPVYFGSAMLAVALIVARPYLMYRAD